MNRKQFMSLMCGAVAAPFVVKKAALPILHCLSDRQHIWQTMAFHDAMQLAPETA